MVRNQGGRKWRIGVFWILITPALFLGCAYGPVLYPNTHLKTVGEEQARRDIQECDRLAEEYVKSPAGLAAAESTAVGAAGGAVVGGVVGGVTGNLGQGAGNRRRCGGCERSGPWVNQILRTGPGLQEFR
ncbi:MAG: hypothetical protein NTY64_12060 [Deltaproteobacteria bacterium]|nr:hypothetical protein [Deltaproteobacteria bacterium]